MKERKQERPTWSLLSALHAVAEEVVLGATAAMLGPGEETMLTH